MERRAQCMTAGETTACRYGVESPHTTDDEILGPGQTQLAQPVAEAAARSSPDMPRQIPTPHASADCQRIGQIRQPTIRRRDDGGPLDQLRRPS
jgi:hypothetical protein